MKQIYQQQPLAFCPHVHIGQKSACGGSFNIPIHCIPHSVVTPQQRPQRSNTNILRSSPSSSDFDSSNNKKNDDEIPNQDVFNSDDDFRFEQQQQHRDDDFLNFDEELLEEFLQFPTPNDLDAVDNGQEDPASMDFDKDLKELEKFIDEQTYMNNTGDEFEMFEDEISPQNNLDDLSPTTTITSSVDSSSSPLSPSSSVTPSSVAPSSVAPLSPALEEALLQGVVPAAAGVGSNCLPGDYGFDPFGFSTRDYFKKTQNFFLSVIPTSNEEKNVEKDESNTGAALPLSTKPESVPLYDDSKRPPALILRDYREAEIRHGRLAMLGAILWPLQEIIDRLFIPESFGHTTIVYGGPTLPFISLFMTLVMLLLGYLDIYAASIKDVESGDAFLPGECFWDPLSILDGAPDPMKRKMQERELNNGRMAMIAVLSYILQEGITHEPVINLPWNQVLFEPAFEIPEVQAWLDVKFAGRVTDTKTILDTVGVDDIDLMINEIDPTGLEAPTSSTR